ncbi:hypothetical protein ACH5RR_008102 [Cinchona calisaya]|uniref:Uncharacterized protein n=1 Tax=Cinchona calisaya TaxID=153742 RepID=A0ABD3AEA1_9GENT
MEREERRRRIVERGSDRLALITGQIHNLESPPLTPSPKSHNNNYSHTRNQSAPAAVNPIVSNDLSFSQDDQEYYQSPQQPHLNEEKQDSSATFNKEAQFSATDTRITTKASDDHAEIFLKSSSSVIAYANLPRHIVKSKSLIASRPLYVLLLSDIMIVILRISSSKQRGYGKIDVKKKEAKNLKQNGSNNNVIHWDEAIKLRLEVLGMLATLLNLF